MDKSQLAKWLDKLQEAWETKKPEMAPELCAEKFLWFETPFTKPLENKKDLLGEWQSILDHKDIKLEYEILITNNDFGIVKWEAKFTRISSNEKVLMKGIFQVFLNSNGKCTEFHQWYSIQ